MSKLDQILAFIESGAEWAATIPGVGEAAGVASVLLKIAQAAVQQHEKITGEPLDIAKLHELPHV